jgi:hypothetical protein
MPKLTGPSLERCANIARAIDSEMEKPSVQRKSIFIRTNSPKSLKAQFAAYKSEIRRDLNGAFWMIVFDSRGRGTGDHPIHGRCIEISFTQSGTRKVSYEIVREDEDQFEIHHEKEGHLNGSSYILAEIRELDDQGAAMFLLLESPDNLKLRMDLLSQETRNYISDPQNADPSALINMLIKRGYTFDVRGDYLWIWRGSEG